MRKVDELRNVIANQFACEYKAYDLVGICNAYGIEPDAGLNPMNSKRLYVLSGLNKLPDDDIWKLARRIVKEFENTEMIKTMEPYLADTELVFSFVTRRRIVDFLDSLSDMEGQMKLDDFLSFIWNMSEIPDIFIGTTVGEEIMSAVKYDKTMSYKELLTNRLEVKYLPDEIFIKFLECLVKPEVREGDEQKKYVQDINGIIKEDGYTDNCLFYNFEIGADGLQWNTLIEWWKENNKENDDDPELALYGRLRASLDSEPEKIFFRAYYNYYRHPVKKNIPALVPQVYLHYDPRSKYQRKRQVVYSHQRMDFLMLLPGGIQIVFELDGQQHYSQNGKAVPALYAEMVKDDRALRLKGYEVYRFGGYEFLDETNAKQMICEFFDKLFERYEINL